MPRVILLITVLSLAGCTTSPRGPRRPADINHLVFFKLADPTLADDLIADNQRRLATIPGVQSMFCGRHLDTGRDTVTVDYDVALYLGFRTIDDYRAFLDDPAHQQLVRDWKPRLESLRIYDVRAEAP